MLDTVITNGRQIDTVERVSFRKNFFRHLFLPPKSHLKTSGRPASIVTKRAKRAQSQRASERSERASCSRASPYIPTISQCDSLGGPPYILHSVISNGRQIDTVERVSSFKNFSFTETIFVLSDVLASRLISISFTFSPRPALH